MNHVMLDLETLGNGPTAAIASIGAVFFDPVEGKLGKEFYRVISSASCQTVGLKIDAATVEWWMGQDSEARSIFADTKTDIRQALINFTDYLGGNFYDRKLAPEGLTVWGNGSTFDNVIISSAYEACGLQKPWSHRNDMCYRTFRRRFQPRNTFAHGVKAPGEVKHNALDDARYQARELINLVEAIRAGSFNLIF
jgi:hypothetical protein